jgi:hypothetical protein
MIKYNNARIPIIKKPPSTTTNPSPINDSRIVTISILQSPSKAETTKLIFQMITNSPGIKKLLMKKSAEY